MTMRNRILLFTLLILLISVNYTIVKREQLVSHGRSVLLELAPVDPRSLMQGDYMALRFKLVNEAFPSDRIKGMKDGLMILTVDERGIGRFSRFAANTTPAAGEQLLRYRIRKDQPKLATNAFFFQEKQGKLYEQATYGEFKIASDGEAILVALRGKNLQKLGP